MQNLPNRHSGDPLPNPLPQAGEGTITLSPFGERVGERGNRTDGSLIVSVMNYVKAYD
jgi:hypothetical protein